MVLVGCVGWLVLKDLADGMIWQMGEWTNDLVRASLSEHSGKMGKQEISDVNVIQRFFKKNTLTNTLTDNFDPDPILEKVSQKYGGTYQTDEKTFVEFSLKGRKFFVAPDIETSQISLLGSDVTGMSFSCSVRSHFTFWIVQNDLFDNPFDTAGDTKCRHKIGKFLLITNDVKIQNILLENKKFLKHIDSLSEGMYFLSVRDQKNLWYANQTYQDGMIEKMNDLAQVVEEIVIS